MNDPDAERDVDAMQHDSLDADSGDRIDALVDQFMQQQRDGISPSIDEFAKHYPELEFELRQILETVLAVDRLRPDSQLGAPTSIETCGGTELPRIKDYELVRIAGRGGMGVVYEAIQRSLDRRVALKVLPQSLMHNETARERFQLEARAAARLHHTNIVPVHEVGSDNDHDFYAMQFIEGDALDDVIASLREIRQHNVDRGRHGLPSSKLTRRTTSSEIPDRNLARRQTIALSLDGLIPNAESRESGGPGLEETGHGSESFPATAGLPDSNRESRGGEVNAPASNAHVDTKGGRSDPSSTFASSSNTKPFFINAARIGRQVASALQYAHDNGIVHRDIKPSNLMLDVSGEVWVTDFGLAKLDESSDLTTAGDVVGTLRYMSPERFEGKCDARSDTYSLGVTLYELIALQSPFHASDRIKLIDQIKSANPPKLRSLNRRVPYDLQTIIEKAMDANRSRRYQTARAMHDDLDRFINGQPVRARRVSSVERLWLWSKKNAALATTLAAFWLVLVIGVIGSTWAAIHFRQQEKIQSNLASINENLAFEKEVKAEAAIEQRDAAYRNAYFADMRQSQTDYQNGQVRRMLTTLRTYADADPANHVRGWEWYYLLSLAHQDKHTIAYEPGSPIQIGWAADGQRLFGLGGDNTFRVWDRDGNPIRKFKVPGAIGFALSPDTSEVAFANGSSLLHLIGTDTGKLIRIQKTEFHSIDAVDWNQSNQIAIAGSHPRNEVVILNPETWEPVHRAVCPWQVTMVRLNSSGDSLIVTSSNHIEVFDCRTTPKPYANLRGNHFFDTRSIAWHPDNRRFAIGAYGRGAEVWQIDSETSNARKLAAYHFADTAFSLEFTPDGRELIMGSDSQRIDLIDLDTGQTTRSFKGHLNAVKSVAQDPEGELIASLSVDGSIKIWEREPPTVPAPPEQTVAHSGTFSGGRWAWERDLDERCLAIVDVASGKRVARLPVVDASAATPSLEFHRSGKHAVFSVSNQFFVFDTNHWNLIAVLRGELQSNGNFVVAKNGPRTFQSFNRQTGKVTAIDVMFDLDRSGWQLSPDGSRLAVCASGQVSVWDLETGSELATFFGQWPGVLMPTIAVSNSGRYVATASLDQTIAIWDVKEQKLLQTLLGMQRVISTTEFGFTADDRRFTATDGTDRKVWDVQTGREILSLAAGSTATFYADFCSDNPQVRFGLTDRELHFERLKFVDSTRDIRKMIEKLEIQTLRPRAELQLIDRHSGGFNPGRGLHKATRALELSPTDPKVLFTHALAQHRAGQPDQALASLSQAMDYGFNFDRANAAVAEFLRAACQKQLGNESDAAAAFTAANLALANIGTYPANHRRLTVEIAEAFLPTAESSRANEPIIVNVLTDEIDGIADGNVSLREAVMSSADGGAIQIATAGTIVLKLGHIRLDKSLTIVGPGAEKLAISGAGKSRIFLVDDHDDQHQTRVELSGMRMTAGRSAGSSPDNALNWGGAIHSEESLVVRDSVFDNNYSPHSGGAVVVGRNSSASFVRCTFQRNVANQGAAIQLTRSAKFASIDSCTFNDNQANLGKGSAIRAGGGTERLSVTNSTFSGNRAGIASDGRYGGAITANCQQTTIDHCTFTNNLGGAVSNDLLWQDWTLAGKPQLIISNSILAENRDERGRPLDLVCYDGVQPTVTDSLIGAAPALLIDGDTNRVGIDPQLDPLEDNGGATKTHALHRGSPAIDAGGNTDLKFDQRGEGFPRVVGSAADLGAVEMK